MLTLRDRLKIKNEERARVSEWVRHLRPDEAIAWLRAYREDLDAEIADLERQDAPSSRA